MQALTWGPPLFLGLAAALAGTCSGSSSHSMRYFITSVSEPGQQVPQFFYVGYVDDQEFVSYDARTKKCLPNGPWIRKVEKDDPDYWERNSQYAQGHERSFQDHMVTLAEYYNHSGGVHTFQWMYGCEQKKDGSTGGYYKYAYDGRDYISLDKETLTWTAADGPAQKTKKKWDVYSTDNMYKKAYLEKTCIKWLQRFLNYGKEMPLRTEKPEVNVTRKVEHDGMETLICRVAGFYPKDIDIDWRRDGEVCAQETFHGLVSPNSDGTYYTWQNITVDPKERDHYKCHVEHDGLLNPVDMAWEEPASASIWSFIIAYVGGFVAGLEGMTCLIAHFKKRQEYYEAAAASASIRGLKIASVRGVATVLLVSVMTLVIAIFKKRQEYYEAAAASASIWVLIIAFVGGFVAGLVAGMTLYIANSIKRPEYYNVAGGERRKY